MWPSRTAKNNGVNPDLSLARTSAPLVDEGLHDRGVPFGRGPHQGRLIAPLPRVGVGASRKQRLHRVEISRARRRHEDGLAARKRRVRVGTGIEQQLDESRVAVRARPATAEARRSDSRR